MTRSQPQDEWDVVPGEEAPFPVRRPCAEVAAMHVVTTSVPPRAERRGHAAPEHRARTYYFDDEQPEVDERRGATAVEEDERVMDLEELLESQHYAFGA